MRTWIHEHGQTIAFLILVAALAVALNGVIRKDSNTIYQSQIQACERGNHLREESNHRIGAHTADTAVLRDFLIAARSARISNYQQTHHRSDLLAARRYAYDVRVLDAKVKFRPVEIVNCTKAIPKP